MGIGLVTIAPSGGVGALMEGPACCAVPPPLRLLGRLGRVADFLDLSIDDGQPSSTPAAGAETTAAVPPR